MAISRCSMLDLGTMQTSLYHVAMLVLGGSGEQQILPNHPPPLTDLLTCWTAELCLASNILFVVIFSLISLMVSCLMLRSANRGTCARKGCYSLSARWKNQSSVGILDT